MPGGFSNSSSESVVYANNVDFRGVAPVSGQVVADGQLLIGSAADPNIRVATLTPGAGVTITNGPGSITIGLSGGGQAIDTITGDSGGAVSADASGNININAGNSTLVSGATVSLVGTPGSNLVQLQVTDSSQNTIIGNGAGNLTLTQSFNTILGYQAGAALTSGEGGNTLVGWKAGNAITSGNNNQGFGHDSLLNLLTGVQNNGFGNSTLQTITTGSFNVAIGEGAGSSCTGSDSSNIFIGNVAGTAGDNHRIRIGQQGSADGQQNTCFIAGIVGVTTANTQFVTINSSTGQLGVVATAGFTWTDVSGAFSPLKENGYFITGTATGTLPAAPSQGDTIKFFVDHASQVLTIQATAGKIIRLGSLVSSAGGTAVSTLQGDSVELTYRTSDTCWCAIAGFSGTWTLT